MGRKAAVISIDVNAGTAKMLLDLEKGKAGLREFGRTAGHDAVSGVQATSGALRVLEGNMTNNLRASERFLANVLHLGPALQAAFPVVGAIAFAGIIGEAGKKLYEFFRSAEEAPGKIANAFRQLNEPLHTTNDELRVTNDRLANDIAKLEGRQENTLKLALDEARVVADKLAESLEKDIAALEKLQKEQGLGALEAFFTGQAGTGQDQEDIKRFSDVMGQINAHGAAAVRAAGGPAAAKAAQDAWNREALNAIDAEIRNFETLAQKSRRLQDLHEGKGNAPTWLEYQQHPDKYTGYNTTVNTPDQSAVLAERQSTLEYLQSIRDRYSLSADNASLQGQKEVAEAAKEAQRKAEEAARKQAELDRQRYAFLRGIDRYEREMAAKREAELGRLGDAYAITSEELKKKFSEDKLNLPFFVKNAPGIAPPPGYETQQEQQARLEHQSRMAQIGTFTPQQAAQQERDARLATIEEMRKREIGALADQEKIREANDAARLRSEEAVYQYEEKIAQLRQKGVKDFFLEMQGPAQTMGNVLYEGLHSGLDKFSVEFTKLITGQKTSFAKMFESVGEQMIEQSVKSAAQKGLGQLGKLLGIHAPGAVHRPTGNPGDPVHVFVDNPIGQNASQAPNFTPVPVSGATAGAIGGVVKSGAPGLAGFLRGLFSEGGEAVSSSITYMAEGGDVDPGVPYWVGDGGEKELFTPRTSGTITPLHKLGGDTHATYIVDARGADLGAANRINQGLRQTHNAAVATSVRANVERSKRTPQRSGPRH